MHRHTHVAAMQGGGQGQVSSGTVAGKNEATGAQLAEPGADPLERRHTVLVCRREGVFGREAVVDLDDHRWSTGGDARGLVLVGVEAAENPSSAVYEEDHGLRLADRSLDAQRHRVTVGRHGGVRDRADGVGGSAVDRQHELSTSPGLDRVVGGERIVHSFVLEGGQAGCVVRVQERSAIAFEASAKEVDRATDHLRCCARALEDVSPVGLDELDRYGGAFESSSQCAAVAPRGRSCRRVRGR